MQSKTTTGPAGSLTGDAGGDKERTFLIRYEAQSTMPERIDRHAADLEITPEQLIRRFISNAMRDNECDNEPATPGETLEDFLVKNGVWKAP